MSPRVSIIIPVYNAAVTLTPCLESIYAQSFIDWELIIVNDGSTDASSDIIEHHRERLAHVIDQKNAGAPVARNQGAAVSQGEYLLFCDADVVLHGDYLEKLVKALEANPEVAFAYASFLFGSKLFKLWPFNIEKLKQVPYIHTTSLIRRSAFPGFDEALKKFQDWDLFLTIAERGGKGVWIDEVLFEVTTGGTMSNWLPSFAYKLLPWLPSVKKYQAAKRVIIEKHNLTV